MLTEKQLQVLLLRKKGLLQEEIAKRMGITQSAVSSFEANAKTKVRQAKRELALLDELHIKHES